jgi:hypothetical protein
LALRHDQIAARGDKFPQVNGNDAAVPRNGFAANRAGQDRAHGNRPKADQQMNDLNDRVKLTDQKVRLTNPQDDRQHASENCARDKAKRDAFRYATIASAHKAKTTPAPSASCKVTSPVSFPSQFPGPESEP